MARHSAQHLARHLARHLAWLCRFRENQMEVNKHLEDMSSIQQLNAVVSEKTKWRGEQTSRGYEQHSTAQRCRFRENQMEVNKHLEDMSSIQQLNAGYFWDEGRGTVDVVSDTEGGAPLRVR